MVDLPEVPDRPLPRPALFERALAWLRWVGPARVAAGSLAVVAVVAGGYWLVRPPRPTTESTLPYAPGAGATSTAAADPGSTQATTTPATDPAQVVVHVAGAVVSAGVYTLPEGARVIDAVQLAGGFAADAQPDAVNLAAHVTDGARIYVPRVGEPSPPPAAAGGSVAPSGPIDLNTATVDELDELPGVGPATAAAIVAHREQHGPFGSVDDLADVRGIGPAKLEALRGLVTV